MEHKVPKFIMELYRQEERAHEDAALNLFASMFLPLETEGITVSIGDGRPVKPKVNPWKIVRKQSKIIKKQEKELKGYRDMKAFPVHSVIPWNGPGSMGGCGPVYTS